MPTTKTFARQYLTPVAAPLPPVSEAATVGRALVESLSRSAHQRRSLRLHRLGGGRFETRFENQRGYSKTLDHRIGALAEVLSNPSALSLDDRVRRLLGIPLRAEQPLVGELLIRLYEQAASLDLWLAFEYLPWSEAPLRYRLRLQRWDEGIIADRDFFIHARTAEALLIAGLSFLATRPVTHP